MRIGLTASVLIDLQRFCFMTLTPCSSPAPCVKRDKEEKYGPLPPFFVLYIPHSNNNFVKHAKPLNLLHATCARARRRSQAGARGARTSAARGSGSPECVRTQKEQKEKGKKRKERNVKLQSD